MCGIAGIIGRLDDANRAALERMNDAMVHRGPDASGTWVSAPDSRGWGALLAHRRLSILDLSPAGAQPMVDPVTGHVIVFNGEIYNFRDLRRRLSGRGAGATIHRRHGRDASRARPARARSSGLASRYVRLRLLGPQGAPAPAGQGSPRNQASLPGAVVGSGCGLVVGLRLGASRPAGVRAAGRASPRPAGRGQQRVERLRGRPRHRRQRRRPALAGPPARVRRRRARRFASRTSGASPTAHPIRSRTSTVWPPSWRRG